MNVDELRALEVKRVAYTLAYDNSEPMCPTEPESVARRDVAEFEAGIIQAERRRILDNSLFQFGMGDGTYMMIRTSVVDPKEDEKK